MINPAAQKQKTARALQACIVLIDTAEWMKSELRAPLGLFDLTMREFRLLELLYREGALPVVDIAVKLQARPNNVRRLNALLGECGWVRLASVTLPPVEFGRSHLAKSERDKPRTGRRIRVAGLTRAGKKFMKDVLPRHSKLVKALMQVLKGREQKTLVRICEKLREGDVLKFVSEITHEDAEE
jgi:MarR family transcriptional regulator, 2-MHQ and catechol-resistance regulon repressor